jgi:hypothetical protein
LIFHAALVVADISKLRPNVFYELGYATARGKPVIITANRTGAKKVPIDLRGLEILIHDDTKEGMELFERSFTEHVRLRMTSRPGLLRDMLIPTDPHPSYILCSPNPPPPPANDTYIPSIFGDYIGVVGIVNAFGALLGEGYAPALIGSRNLRPDMGDLDANLYLIGSPVVNDLVAEFLDAIQGGSSPKWRFVENPDYRGPQDCRTFLRGDRPIQLGPLPDGVLRQDVGIVVRGPHPRHPRRQVLIMAGQRSLGTGAACLAATRSELIAKIQEKLPDRKFLGHKDFAAWAVVRGYRRSKEQRLTLEDVEVLDAGVYG